VADEYAWFFHILTRNVVTSKNVVFFKGFSKFVPSGDKRELTYNGEGP
jgi:hypothetical protein